jgi:hypothetical protein
MSRRTLPKPDLLRLWPRVSRSLRFKIYSVKVQAIAMPIFNTYQPLVSGDPRASFVLLSDSLIGFLRRPSEPSRIAERNEFGIGPKS